MIRNRVEIKIGGQESNDYYVELKCYGIMENSRKIDMWIKLKYDKIYEVHKYYNRWNSFTYYNDSQDFFDSLTVVYGRPVFCPLDNGGYKYYWNFDDGKTKSGMCVVRGKSSLVVMLYKGNRYYSSNDIYYDHK
jgi:hypothetical protein